MTDKEIIKALECCGKLYNLCDECPISNDIKDDCKCGEYLAKNALNLINRQQAEIEDLNKSRNGLLRKCVSAYHEGINCFAERLCDGRVSNDPVVIAVKAELKEMVGEYK